jgi:hypothetical protein
MRILALSLVLCSLAVTAQAAPRQQPWSRIEEPKPVGSLPPLNAPEAKPFKPYKPYSVYGDDPTSLSPGRTPPHVPGYKPYNPPFREKGTFGGSKGTFGRGGGTF